MVVLYVLLFILCLSILIVVHEAGHLTAAKIFKVYCFDFSIGFGPAFLHKKKKNGETYFSLRCIPFGGFVSMYGEGVEVPEGMEIEPSRNLQNIRKWKQAIIMVAGVTMNAILAIVIFFISNQACIHYTYYLRYSDKVTPGSLAYNTELRTDLEVEHLPLYMNLVLKDDGGATNLYEFSVDGTLTYYDDNLKTDVTKTNVGYALDTSKFTKDVRSYDDICMFYETYIPTRAGATRTIDVSKPLKNANIKKATFSIASCPMITDPDGTSHYDVDNKKTYTFVDVAFDSNTHKLATPLGLTLFRDDKWYDFPTAFKQTFVDFSNASVALFKGLGSLFTPAGWQNVGGIVAIGVTTTNTLTNQGIAAFLYYWGFISINLAIVNLLPFPGLDGWHLLVVIIEGISRKKIPAKFKNVASLIGLVLLFTLMILIIVKDIITLV